MGTSYLARGIFYNVLGIFFVFLAIQDVRTNELGFFTYLLIILATLDIGTGIRFMLIHFKQQKSQK